MDRLIIRGGRRIEGSVQICGAKNAALPQIAAALLSSERLELGNVPEVSDINTMLALMGEFGVAATRGPGRILVLDARGARNAQAPYDLVRRMRASILVLAPLLARFGSARVSLPGGCAIGARPIDLHLKALDALGADVEMESGYINVKAKGDGLRGDRIVLSSPSVGATETALMAAVLARGESEILNAARDPEHLGSVGAILESAGTQIWPTDRGLMVVRSGPLQAVDVSTEPYPGFPTDLQAQFMALMTVASGASVIRETVFESRFMHVPELGRLGANISLQGSTALVRGVERLHGAEVMATDLRASVSLVLAALVADGETTVNRVYHLDRGYESLDRKLVQCGADIQRVAG
jgi:UDP-N-acetylglucosamine 1-carboxyvinyltransferase